jgi:hypothetical protein
MAMNSSMFAIRSPAFEDNTAIPRQYTSEGENISPPLEWADPPLATESFALIMEDPDAPDPQNPQQSWVHWVLYDLPANTTFLPADADKNHLPAGARRGLNDWNHTEYGGPDPPVGEHRYLCRLYALDTILRKLPRPTRKNLLDAMEGHVLDRAEIVGTYKKSW